GDQADCSPASLEEMQAQVDGKKAQVFFWQCGRPLQSSEKPYLHLAPQPQQTQQDQRRDQYVSRTHEKRAPLSLRYAHAQGSAQRRDHCLCLCIQRLICIRGEICRCEEK